jgi:hypothetical protein
MTSERQKALLIMAVTLVIGIIIGSLATGMFARQFYHGRGGHRTDGREISEGRRGNLVDRIYKTVKADSGQRLLMKPIIDQTMARIDNLQARSRAEARVVLDSLKIKLRPILRTEQVGQLEEFLSFKGKPSQGKGKHDHHQ